MKTISKYKICVISLFVVMLVVSCKKEIEYQLPTGDLIGYVILRDQEGHQLADHSGVEVVIEGSNPQKSTYSDERGKYVIEELQTGTYNILYSKPGFGKHKKNGYMFVGGVKPSMVRWQILYRQTEMRIENLKLFKSEWQLPYVELRATADLINESSYNCPYLRCYLSNSENVSYMNYRSNFVITHNNDNILDFYLEVDTNQFPVNTELYMIIYPSPDVFNGYNDLLTDIYIYTGLNIENASNIAGVIIPRPDVTK